MDSSLQPLLAPLTSLRGVGPALAEKIARVAGGGRVLDLLFHMPDGYLDRSNQPLLTQAEQGSVATLLVEVVGIEEGLPPRPWRVVIRDRSGFGEVAYFGHRPPPVFQKGAKLAISGKIDLFNGRVQLRNPDRVAPMDKVGELAGLEPIWPLTAGLFPGQLRLAMMRALALVPELPEWHDKALIRREAWPGFRDALHAVQAPKSLPVDAARARLAYDELLAHQVAMAWARQRERRRPGRAITGDGALRAKALERFGQPPTPSQVRALAEIDADLAAPHRMLRLLQGDVGSGKTLVALLAMLRAAEAGRQAALMAPTELLAKQHHRTLTALSPVPVLLLTGSIKGAERRHALRGIAEGRIPLIVGTHALFQEAVQYHDLALAVIDEQHRFGVDQRLLMGAKGERTDVLVMTATPIPRTLLLTQWGEMEVSRLTDKPGGRRPIRTTIHSLATLPDVLEGIGRALDRGEQVYWVCPLVAESELVDLAAAEARFAVLYERFPGRVGLAHGRQEAAVRDAALADFAAGRLRLLVATTVVEVGVDVPQATIMVIEHAERFGLAQLHQLRGRVGRGRDQSFCLLLHEDGLTDTMRRRLTLLRDTEDGFRIADEDFRLRGGGDLLGKRQSGLPGFKLADPDQHERLLHMAHRDASALLERDARLESERGRALQALLRLFERREAVQTLAAG
ncbi:MAG TPA: ATP-dependent DNA helicase RecG [Acetobacteraceae bacterium]|nr:ATP-dependent DNA helicase RecG [Acetobacteraceae bacterium]